MESKRTDLLIRTSPDAIGLKQSFSSHSLSDLPSLSPKNKSLSIYDELSFNNHHSDYAFQISQLKEELQLSIQKNMQVAQELKDAKALVERQNLKMRRLKDRNKRLVKTIEQRETSDAVLYEMKKSIANKDLIID